MTLFRPLATAAIAAAVAFAAPAALAMEIRSERIDIPRGAAGTELAGMIQGEEFVEYQLPAVTGQQVSLTLSSSNRYVHMGVAEPGSRREVFDGAVVVVCNEPEFSIAKGLAYAGWVDDNLRAFRAAIRAEVTDARVGAVAQDAFAELVPGVVDVLCPLIVEEAAIPVALQWKKGEIDTLREMNNRIQRRAERVLASPMTEQALAPVLEKWLAQLTPSLQAMVDPICDRYHVPRDEMRLVLMQTGETGDLRFGAKQLLGFSLIGILVGVALSVLVALLCGGGGIALIATGPLGLVAGAAVGAVVAALGWPAVTEMLLGAHLPRMMRLVNVEARLRSETTQRTLRDSLFRELGGRNSEFSQKLVSAFTDAFQKYLARIAQAAEVPIQ